MKKSIVSKIEHLNSKTEEAIIVSLQISDLPTAIILFSALKCRHLDKVTFRDGAYNNSFVMTYAEENDKKEEYLLKFSDRTIPLSKTWFDAVLGMMIDVHLNGWYQGAHIDQEIGAAQICFDLCFAVDPPTFE